jgi:hypothetical protein
MVIPFGTHGRALRLSVYRIFAAFSPCISSWH